MLRGNVVVRGNGMEESIEMVKRATTATEIRIGEIDGAARAGSAIDLGEVSVHG